MSLKNKSGAFAPIRLNLGTGVGASSGGIGSSPGLVNDSNIILLPPTQQDSPDWAEALLNATSLPHVINEMPTEIFDQDDSNVTSTTNLVIEAPSFTLRDMAAGESVNSLTGEFSPLSLSPARGLSTHSTLNTPTVELERAPSFSSVIRPSPLALNSVSATTASSITFNTATLGFNALSPEAMVVNNDHNGENLCPATAASWCDVDSTWNLVPAAPLALVEGRLVGQCAESTYGLSPIVVHEAQNNNAVNVPLKVEIIEPSSSSSTVDTEVLGEFIVEQESGSLVLKSDENFNDDANDDLLNPEEYQHILEETDMDDSTIGDIYQSSCWQLNDNSVDSTISDSQLTVMNLMATSPTPSTSSFTEEFRPPSSIGKAPSSRKRRGRPPVPYNRPITPQVPRTARRLPVVSPQNLADVKPESSESEMTDQEVAEQRYRRMRDLNNEASKRCRAKRKEKFSMLDEMLHAEEAKNFALKQRMQRLEAKLAKAKRLLPLILKPSTSLNKDTIDRLLGMLNNDH